MIKTRKAITKINPIRRRTKNNRKNKYKGGKASTCKYNSSIKLEKKNCSPLGENDYTCYTDKSLQIMKNLWNAKHEDCPIEDNDSKIIWTKLKGFMGDVCDTESCWLKQNFIKNKLNVELLNYTFSPEAPDEWKDNPRTWLSSVDIEKVMKQYEVKYKNFKFIGPSPIDFDTKKMYSECVWDELCKFSLQNMLDKGVNMIGIIFNTDPHTKGGAHWISMFINLKKNKIYYFDSVGDPIPEEIDIFVERVQDEGSKIKRKIYYEDTEGIGHQKQDTECGIYSLYFIVKMLENVDFSEFNSPSKLIHDDDIVKYRKIFFN
jgi:hypothetical protein